MFDKLVIRNNKNYYRNMPKHKFSRNKTLFKRNHEKIQLNNSMRESGIIKNLQHLVSKKQTLKAIIAK